MDIFEDTKFRNLIFGIFGGLFLGFLIFGIFGLKIEKFENDEMYWDIPGPDFFDQQQDPSIEPVDQEPAKVAGFHETHDPHHNHDHDHNGPWHSDFSDPGPHPGPCCPHPRYGPPGRIRYNPQTPA